MESVLNGRLTNLNMLNYVNNIMFQLLYPVRRVKTWILLQLSHIRLATASDHNIMHTDKSISPSDNAAKRQG